MKFKLLSLVLLVASANSAWAIEIVDKSVNNPDGEATVVRSLPNGMTVYIFDLDGPESSNCKGTCAEKWPPVLLTQEEASSLTQPGLGTITRDSGLVQLTLNERPLYTYFVDRTNADLKGNGVGGVWHVVVAN